MRGPFRSSSFISILLLGGLLAGCPGPEETLYPDGDPRGLTPPKTTSLGAAEEFHSRMPQVSVGFSQVTGHVLWLRGSPETPLQTGPSATGEDALETLLNFLDQDANGKSELFDIDHLQDALKIRKNYWGEVAYRYDTETGLRFLQVSRFWEGNELGSDFGLATFDKDGNLVSFVSNLTPDAEVAALFNAPPETSSNTPGVSVQSTPLPQGPQLQWVDLGQLRKNGLLRPVVKIEREGAITIRTYKDIRTGEVIVERELPTSLVDLPDHWESKIEGETPSPAIDSRGDTRLITSSLMSDPSTGSPVLVLAHGLPEIFNPGSFLSIGNADHSIYMPDSPIATDQKSWADEEGFSKKTPIDLRPATGLDINLKATLSFVHENYGLRSWDGTGASLYGAIQANHQKDSSTADMNAWAGNGRIFIGDGISKKGLSIADSLDVVAHEFTHNIVDATADLRYYGESGALEESLADIFGLSVAGFEYSTIGKTIGWEIRDVLQPGKFHDPHKYGDFIVTTKDNGGVHSNSGIMNYALASTIKDSTLTHLDEPSHILVTRLILRVLQKSPIPMGISMEEFAAHLINFCELTQSDSNQVICATMARHFESSEILPEPIISSGAAR